MQLECKYYNQVVQSLIDMQSTQRLPLESIRDWAINNRVAIYKVKNYVEFGLIGIVRGIITDNQRWVRDQYSKLNICISHLEDFYIIYKQVDYALSALEELTACNDDEDLINDWLIRHYLVHKKCFHFLLNYSYKSGDSKEENQYVYSSDYLKIVIGFESSSFIPVEEFSDMYVDLLSKYELWDKINDMFEQKRNVIIKYAF